MDEAKQRFIGLDLSLTATGYVALDEAGTIVSRNTWGASLPRKARVRDKIERMIYIAEKIVGAVSSMKVAHALATASWEARNQMEVHVGIEGFAYGARGAQNDLGEIQGIVKSQLWLALQIEPVIITSSTARKAVMGKGNFPKSEILTALVGRGLELKNHNEADAYVIAECLRLSTQGVGR